MTAEKPMPPADKAVLLQLEATLSLPNVGSDNRTRLLHMAYELGRSTGRFEGAVSTGDAMMKAIS